MKSIFLFPLAILLFACSCGDGGDPQEPSARQCTDCSDDCVQTSYENHKVTKEVFDGITYPLGDGAANEGHPISFSCIETAANSISNCSNLVLICYDPTDNSQTSNTGIRVGVQLPNPGDKQQRSSYPVQLLKYIAKKKPREVLFYNGREGETAKVVFSFKKWFTTRRLNLSGDYPPNETFIDICDPDFAEKVRALENGSITTQIQSAGNRAKSCEELSQGCITSHYNNHAINDSVFHRLTYPLNRPLNQDAHPPKKIGFKCLDDAMKAIERHPEAGRFLFICRDTSNGNERSSNQAIIVGYNLPDEKTSNMLPVGSKYPIQILKFIVSRKPDTVLFYNGFKDTSEILIRFRDPSNNAWHRFDLSGDYPPTEPMTQICK